MKSNEIPFLKPGISFNLESSSEKTLSSDKSNYNSTRKTQFYSNAQLMSPIQKDIVQFKDYFTPIAQFSENKNRIDVLNNEASPLIKIHLNSIRSIAQKQKEESQNCQMKSFYQEVQQEQCIEDAFQDIMGNKIYAFNLGQQDSFSNQEQLSIIKEDKQNELPEKLLSNLNTPLKMRQNDLRSPLQDITPSMTHKKKDQRFHTKTNKKNKTTNKAVSHGFAFQIEKLGLLTPKTMAESRLSKTNPSNLQNSKLRIQRFL